LAILKKTKLREGRWDMESISQVSLKLPELRISQVFGVDDILHFGKIEMLWGKY